MENAQDDPRMFATPDDDPYNGGGPPLEFDTFLSEHQSQGLRTEYLLIVWQWACSRLWNAGWVAKPLHRIAGPCQLRDRQQSVGIS